MELFIETLFVGSVIKSPMSLVDSVFTEAVVKLSFVNSADTAPPPDIEAALSPFSGKKALKLSSSPKLSNSSVLCNAVHPVSAYCFANVAGAILVVGASCFVYDVYSAYVVDSALGLYSVRVVHVVLLYVMLHMVHGQRL